MNKEIPPLLFAVATLGAGLLLSKLLPSFTTTVLLPKKGWFGGTREVSV